MKERWETVECVTENYGIKKNELIKEWRENSCQIKYSRRPQIINLGVMQAFFFIKT